jgi:hypothetical protein
MRTKPPKERESTVSTTRYHRPRNAKRTEYNGRIYPSKMQARRAYFLDMLVMAGEVAWWIPEVTIQLGPDHRYRVDFLVAVRLPDTGIEVHAEDTKAIETREFARSKRLWAKYGPFDLHVITKTGTEIVRPCP